MSELPPHHEDHPQVVSRNARRGLFLFTLYFALFVAFLLLNVFRPKVMAQTAVAVSDATEISLGGPNLAIVYGIGLIFAAFLLALVYMALTRRRGA
jgi:TRAP-type C4-dicarboxylate transport system permease small subunit